MMQSEKPLVRHIYYFVIARYAWHGCFVGKNISAGAHIKGVCGGGGVTPPAFVKYMQKVGPETVWDEKSVLHLISERDYHFVSKRWTFFVMEMEIYNVKITKTHRQTNKFQSYYASSK